MLTVIDRSIMDLHGVDLLVQKLRGSSIRVLADEKEKIPLSVRLSEELAEIIEDCVQKTGFSKNVVSNLLLWGGVQLLTAQMEAIEAMEEEEFAKIDEMNAHQEGKKC